MICICPHVKGIVELPVILGQVGFREAAGIPLRKDSRKEERVRDAGRLKQSRSSPTACAHAAFVSCTCSSTGLLFGRRNSIQRGILVSLILKGMTHSLTNLTSSMV
jgi:hypothetical protein